jgi:hypothetical protein
MENSGEIILFCLLQLLETIATVTDASGTYQTFSGSECHRNTNYLL